MMLPLAVTCHCMTVIGISHLSAIARHKTAAIGTIASLLDCSQPLSPPQFLLHLHTPHLIIYIRHDVLCLVLVDRLSVVDHEVVFEPRRSHLGGPLVEAFPQAQILEAL